MYHQYYGLQHFNVIVLTFENRYVRKYSYRIQIIRD